MQDVDLSQKYSGRLQVKIKGVGEFGAEFQDEPLLSFIGNVYVVLTGERLFQRNEGTWKVLNFSPEEGVLEVEKVA